MPPLLQHLLACADTGYRLHPELLLLHVGQVIYEPGQLRPYVYFPDGALIALVFAQDKGHSCEICYQGRNGMLGLQHLMGPQASGYSAIVQQGGRAWRLPAERLHALFEQHAPVRQLLLQHLQSAITQMSQLVICHRHHQLEQQLARLLLQFIDNSGDRRVNVTHERLATLLGVRREGITLKARELAGLDLVGIRRGCIEVFDAQRLATYACDCLPKLRLAQRWLGHVDAA